jgi:hypothetical protein
VGGRARAPLRKRLLPLAADGPPLRPHLSDPGRRRLPRSERLQTVTMLRPRSPTYFVKYAGSLCPCLARFSPPVRRPRHRPEPPGGRSTANWSVTSRLRVRKR